MLRAIICASTLQVRQPAAPYLGPVAADPDRLRGGGVQQGPGAGGPVRQGPGTGRGPRP